KSTPAVKLRLIGLARVTAAVEGVRLRNGADRRGTQLATDLQALADKKLLCRIDIGEKVDAAGDFGGDAAAVLEHERVLVHGRDPRAFADDARQVERIGRRDKRPIAGGLGVAEIAKATDGGFGGELLAADAGDEPS